MEINIEEGFYSFYHRKSRSNKSPLLSPTFTEPNQFKVDLAHTPASCQLP